VFEVPEDSEAEPAASARIGDGAHAHGHNMHNMHNTTNHMHDMHNILNAEKQARKAAARKAEILEVLNEWGKANRFTPATLQVQAATAPAVKVPAAGAK
jgi:hypothetical protein